MSGTDQIGDLLELYASSSVGQNAIINEEGVANDFDRFMKVVSPDALSDGLIEAFESDRTPPFEEMLSHLFEISTETQKAGLINELGQFWGAEILSSLGLFSATLPISHSVAGSVTPEAFMNAIMKLQTEELKVAGVVSDFYSKHPDDVKKLGAVSLVVIMTKIAAIASKSRKFEDITN